VKKRAKNEPHFSLIVHRVDEGEARKRGLSLGKRRRTLRKEKPRIAHDILEEVGHPAFGGAGQPSWDPPPSWEE